MITTTPNKLVPIEVFTDTKVNVTQRIVKIKTLFFTCKQRAENYAKQIRSYIYTAFNDKGHIIGYCVPK